MTRSPTYTFDIKRRHPGNSVATSLLIALQVTQKYGRRQPTAAELMADFNMSRATAFRWRAAWTYLADAELTPGNGRFAKKLTPKT